MPAGKVPVSIAKFHHHRQSASPENLTTDHSHIRTFPSRKKRPVQTTIQCQSFPRHSLKIRLDPVIPRYVTCQRILLPCTGILSEQIIQFRPGKTIRISCQTSVGQNILAKFAERKSCGTRRTLPHIKGMIDMRNQEKPVESPEIT